MNAKPDIGVVDNTGLTNARMEHFEMGVYINIGELVDQALTFGLTYVWVLPGSGLSQLVTRAFIETAGEQWDVFASYSRVHTDRPMFARVWRKKTPGKEGRTVYVGFPEWGTWGWKELDAITLLATVSYLHMALGLPLVWSPGYMAMDLLKALNLEKRADWLKAPSVDLRQLPLEGGETYPIMRSARDLTWKRDLTAKEKRMKYIHKYDKNSMYLAAATGLLVGEGDPVHVSGEAFDERLPGLWHVRAVQGESPYDGKLLPNPARLPHLTTAMVTCARKLGWQIDVIEGYQWNEQGMYHRTLETWANTLWDVRQRLRVPSAEYKHTEARRNAYRTIGAIAHVGIGKLADEDTTGGLYRPDIWALVVGRACANIFFNVEQIRAKSGLTPILIHTDALWYVSNDAHPETAVPGIIDKAGKLGGYKVVYEKPLLVKDAAATIAKESSPAKLVRLVNQLGGEE
jgi:hypothetical protein